MNLFLNPSKSTYK